MNILVTGGSGFIGRHLSEKIVADNDITFVIRNKAMLFSGNYKTVNCDLSDSNESKDICKNIDVIVHMAGSASLNSKRQEYLEDNVKATQNLLNSAKAHKVKKIIFLSTIKAENGETSYSVSKKQCEDIIINSCAANKISYTILRSSTVYGLEMQSNLLSWISSFNNPLVGKIPNNSSVLPMIGVDDICRIILCCITEKSTSNKIYAISDLKDYKINTIENRARKYLEDCNIKANARYVIPGLAIRAVAIMGDILNAMSMKIPVNSRVAHMLLDNKYRHNDQIFQDCGIAAKQNFYDFLPTLVNQLNKNEY